MDNDIKGQVQQRSLIADEYYYKYIFKKTEKIVSAVFFMVSKSQNIPQDNVVRADLERRAKDTHSIALSLLNLEPEAASYGMQTLLHSLVSLDSILHVYQAMGGISAENLQVILNEIEGVQRSMKRYLHEVSFVIDRIEQTKIAPRSNRVTTPSPTAVITAASSMNEGQKTRADRIVEVLKDTDGLGIKDISLVIKDCSEKTIQRELTSLIENGLVKRDGERRWSRYSLV